jgi:RIO kinase 1
MSSFVAGQFDDIDDEGIVTITNNENLIVLSTEEGALVDVEEVGAEQFDEEYDEEDDMEGFDDLESELLGGEGFVGGKAMASSADLGKKLNLSVRVQNDITRSEKKGEKRVSNCGKDDRATSEQVLDPRTRLILFKLLNNGFLTEIDGENEFGFHGLLVDL